MILIGVGVTLLTRTAADEPPVTNTTVPPITTTVPPTTEAPQPLTPETETLLADFVAAWTKVMRLDRFDLHRRQKIRRIP